MSQFQDIVSKLDLTHEQQASLQNDKDRLDTYFRNLEISESHGLAIYSCDALNIFEVVELPYTVETAVHVQERPVLEPLMKSEEQNWCIVLVSRQHARILRGNQNHLTEIGKVANHVKNQHSQGGWSQARYERSVEREVEWHLDDVNEALMTQLKDEPFDHLVIAANNPHQTKVEDFLHSYLLEKIRGSVNVDEELAHPDEILEAVRPLMEEYSEQRKDEIFARIEAALAAATESQIALGMQPTLEMLYQRRIEVLLYHEGIVCPGHVCSECGWIDTGKSTCPVDGSAMEEDDNVVDNAVALAIQQAAEVITLHPEDPEERELPKNSQIVGLMRF